MIHCKACDAPMTMDYMDEDEKHLEILCDHCKTQAERARDHDQYWYEGLWWNKHWDGREYHEDIA